MRRNAVREKQFIVPLCCCGGPGAGRFTVASNRVLRMEIKNKWSGEEPGIGR